MLSEEEGKFLVNLARRAITTYLTEGEIIKIPEKIMSATEGTGSLKKYIGIIIRSIWETA